MARGRRPNPNTITPKKRRTIVAELRKLQPLPWAFATAKVPVSTGNYWLAKGREPNAPEPYASFALEVDAARAEAGRFTLSHQIAAMVPPAKRTPDMPAYDVKEACNASRWVATHLYSDVFVPRQRTEVTGADGGPVEQHTTGVVVLPAKKPCFLVLPPEDPLPSERVEVEARVVPESHQLPERTAPPAREALALDSSPAERQPQPVTPSPPTDEDAPTTTQSTDPVDAFIRREHQKDRRRGAWW